MLQVFKLKIPPWTTNMNNWKIRLRIMGDGSKKQLELYYLILFFPPNCQISQPPTPRLLPSWHPVQFHPVSSRPSYDSVKIGGLDLAGPAPASCLSSSPFPVWLLHTPALFFSFCSLDVAPTVIRPFSALGHSDLEIWIFAFWSCVWQQDPCSRPLMRTGS